MEQDICPVGVLLNGAIILKDDRIYRVNFPFTDIVHLLPLSIDPTSGSSTRLDDVPEVFMRFGTLIEEGYGLLQNQPLFTITPN